LKGQIYAIKLQTEFWSRVPIAAEDAGDAVSRYPEGFALRTMQRSGESGKFDETDIRLEETMRLSPDAGRLL
jgi:hypothetical protein